jgi:hypothetical protein
MSFKSSSTIQHLAFSIIYKGVHLGLFERNHISPLTQRSQRKSFAVTFDFLQRNHILINEVFTPNLDKPEPNRFKDKKVDHESTKIRRHESLNVVSFCAFNLSCFRDCVSEFSAGKNAKIITKVL